MYGKVVKVWVLHQACIEIVTRAIYTYLFFLIHALSSSAGKEKVVMIAVFLSKVDHKYRPLFNIFLDYSGVRNRLNMISKRQTLPVVYTC